MRILIDMDEVMINTVSCWVKALNNKFGTNVKFEDITDWDMAKAFPDLSENDIWSVFNVEFWANVEPITGSCSAIEYLIKKGHNIYVVTAAYPDSLSYRYMILKMYYPFIPIENVIICHKKQLVDADVLIDDGIHNIEGGKYKTILFNKPWNQSCDYKWIYKANNWSEILGYVNIIEKQLCKNKED